MNELGHGIMIQDNRKLLKLHEAIQTGLIRSCHDLSEGGLAVALAEMAFAGGLGADVRHLGAASLPDDVLLFSESTTRFIVEVRPDKVSALQMHFGSDMPLSQIGQTCQEPRLRIAGASGTRLIEASLTELKEAWQKPLRW